VTFDQNLRKVFIEEVTENLGRFEASLLDFETAPSDPAAIDRIFRIAHSLKGSSSMMGFTAMARLTHVLESLFDRIRRGTSATSPSVVDTLLASADVLRRLLARIEMNPEAMAQPDEGAERACAAITALLDSADTPRPQPVSAPVGGEKPQLLRIEFRPSADVLQRGLDPLRILAQLAELGQVQAVVPDLSALPSLSDMVPERSYLTWTVTLSTSRPQAELDDLVSFAAGGAGTRIARISDPPDPAAPEEPPRRRTSDRDEGKVIRVAVDKVDRLVDLVGELMTTQSMLALAAGDLTPDGIPRLRDAVARVERHARDLHDRVLAVRMVSVKTLFARFPRLVRDLAGAMGKQIRLELSGEETELDKSVIEKISDPLLHLVRNAVDHGLESPAERRAARKPEIGLLGLEAFQRGGNVYIDVVDDGRGLDRERILAKARRQRLVEPDESPTDDDVFALIFRPGFSTAETVTDVSGRGVGMDVVKQNVAALGGRVTISTQVGRGTRFRVKLPLTLAVLDGQIVTVGDEVYVLPMSVIVESLRPAPGDVHTIEGATEIVRVRQTAIPLLRLHRLFRVEPARRDPCAGLIVVLEHEERRVALLVDGLLAQQQLVIKSLETNFRRVAGISCATILGDGRVALVLDVPGLIEAARTADRPVTDHDGRPMTALAPAQMHGLTD